MELCVQRSVRYHNEEILQEWTLHLHTSQSRKCHAAITLHSKRVFEKMNTVESYTVDFWYALFSDNSSNSYF